MRMYLEGKDKEAVRNYIRKYMGKDISLGKLRKLKTAPRQFRHGRLPIGHSWYSFDTKDLVPLSHRR